jgi:hypothetical protein
MSSRVFKIVLNTFTCSGSILSTIFLKRQTWEPRAIALVHRPALPRWTDRVQLPRIDAEHLGEAALLTTDNQPAQQSWTIEPASFTLASDDGTYATLQCKLPGTNDTRQRNKIPQETGSAWHPQPLRAATRSPASMYNAGLNDYEEVFQSQNETTERNEKTQRRRQQNRAAYVRAYYAY